MMPALSATTVVAFLIFVPGLGTTLGLGSAVQEDAPCQDVDSHPELGPACAVRGGFEILLSGGVRMFTHGFDRQLPQSLVPVVPPAPGEPICVDDPLTQPHTELLYVVPADLHDNYDVIAPLFRSHFLTMAGILRDEAALHGTTAQYKVKCTDGVVDIAKVITPHFAINPVGVIQALDRQGYDSPTAKYLVWNDEPWLCGCLGVAIAVEDDSPGEGNANNIGPGYGMIQPHPWNFAYGYVSLMHENAHTQGAIQPTAPHGDPGFHCTDGPDVMCHFQTTNHEICSAITFDCGRDDYFNPTPANGSYLATHWNLGVPANHFLAFGSQE